MADLTTTEMWLWFVIGFGLASGAVIAAGVIACRLAGAAPRQVITVTVDGAPAARTTCLRARPPVVASGGIDLTDLDFAAAVPDDAAA